MDNCFKRLAAFLLFPCLLSDPAVAYGLSPVDNPATTFTLTNALAAHPVSIPLQRLTAPLWKMAGALIIVAGFSLAQQAPTRDLVPLESLKAPLSPEQLEAVENELIKQDGMYLDALHAANAAPADPQAAHQITIYSNHKSARKIFDETLEEYRRKLGVLLKMILDTTNRKELERFAADHKLKMLPWDLLKEKPPKKSKPPKGNLFRKGPNVLLPRFA